MVRLGGQADHCTKVIAPVSDTRTPRTTTPPIQVVHTGSRIRWKCSGWLCAEPLPAPLPDVAYELNAALVMCQAALAMCQPLPMRGSARGRGARGPLANE